MNDAGAEMPLALVGCDFRVASTAWRSALVLDAEGRAKLRRALEDAAGAAGFAAVDTCNRTEWIVEARRPEWAAGLLRSWMHRLWSERFAGLPLPEPQVLLREDAARHVVRVAVGLESVVPGEREIACQLNKAFETARQEGSTSAVLNELAQTAARTVRRVERRCDFRDATRGVHALALEHVQKHGMPDARVGVVGRGQIGRRVVELFTQAGLPPVALLNRTPARDAEPPWEPLARLPEAASDLDVLVVASGASRPTVRADVLGARRETPLLVVDLGVPPQVERPSRHDGPVTVAGLDELIDGRGLRAAPEQLDEAEREVEAGLHDLRLALRKGAAGPVLRYIQESRDRLGLEGLPALLDEHLTGVGERERRRLESGIRGLVLDRDRELVARLSRLLMSEESDEAIS